MSSSAPQPEPTIADVLLALHGLGEGQNDLRAEMVTKMEAVRDLIRDLHLDVQDVRAEVIGVKSDVNGRFLDVTMRLTTLFDELAAFRAEFNAHGHPDSGVE